MPVLSARPPFDTVSGVSSHLTPGPAPWVFVIPILQLKAELREVCSIP